MSLPASRSDGNVSDRPSPARPSRTARPPGRQISVASAIADGEPGRVDDQVELRGRRRAAVAGQDDLARAELTAPARAPPRGSRRRPDRAGECNRSSAIASEPSVPMPITPDGLAGLRPRLLETVEHDRRGLDQHAGVERDVVGQPVDDPRRHGDQFGVSARSGEPERLDPFAPVRLASAARAAAVAANQPFADDAVAGADRLDVGSRPRPPSPTTRGRGSPGSEPNAGR